MSQSQALYDTSAAVVLIDPWLRAHLPTLDDAVVRRFRQLVTGIFEQRSLLLEAIAEGSAFTATDTSNTTQVRRIIRDARISLETLYYPFLERLLTELSNPVLYLTIDEMTHHNDYCVVQVGLATDGVSLPLGFHIYAPDAPWAEDARTLLGAIDQIIPEDTQVVLLADRVHTGEPFLTCLDELAGTLSFGPLKVRRSSTRRLDGCHSSGSTNVPTRDDTSVRCGSGSKANGALTSASTNWCATAFGRRSGTSSRICRRQRSDWPNIRVDGGRSVRFETAKAICSIGSAGGSQRQSA